MPAATLAPPGATPILSGDIAVVVPCHNYARYLAECLESILAQTLPPVEVIVVDDASSDSTPAIAAQFAPRGVRYLRVECRSPHEARGAGVAATTAPLVCCIDADDRIAPDYLERALPLFQEPRVAIVWSPVREFGERSNRWDPQPSDDIRRSNWIHAGAVFRRAAAEQCRAFDRPNYHTTEDVELWRRFLDAGWSHARNPAEYFYRIHSGSRSELRPRGITRTVMSVYLTSAPDPQRGTPAPKDDWDRVAPWVNGIRPNRLQGLLLHDGLSPEFCRRLEAAGVEPISVPPIPATTHANAWRFLQVAEVLARRSETTAFLTDLFDVTIRADPFPLLRTDFDLWVGIEPWAIDETTSAGRWVLDKLRGTFGDCDPWLKGQPILNAGILGGFRAPLLGLLYDLWSTLAPRGSDERRANCMAALNTLVYRRPDLPRVWRRGAPLHSVFKRYQREAEVCFVHK